MSLGADPVPPARTGMTGGITGGWAAGLAVPLLLGLLWEAAAAAGWLNARLLPPPSRLIVTALALLRDGTLAEHLQATLVRVAGGFALGAGAATLVGALTGRSRVIRALLDPSIQGLRAIPSIAWVPLFVLWFGIFETSKLLLIAVGVFFPIYLGLSQALMLADRKLVEVGRVLGLSPLAILWRILLPGALPAYLVALRGGLGLGWMFVVAAELMGASEGLGWLLSDGQMTARSDIILVALVIFALAGKATDSLLAVLQHRALHWADTTEAQR